MTHYYNVIMEIMLIQINFSKFQTGKLFVVFVLFVLLYYSIWNLKTRL